MLALRRVATLQGLARLGGLGVSSQRYASTTTTVFDIGSETEFTDKVEKSPVPVIVDFHAGWCGPCRMLGPRLEKAVAAEGGNMRLARIDIDDLSELASRFNVSSIPFVVGYAGGKRVAEFLGNVPDPKLNEFLETLKK